MQPTDAVFYIAILIMSVVIHEISHGFMAEYYGDNTARDAGRLTLNPLKHLDLFGSIILPIFLYFTSGFVVGWAKPVPYNPNNLSDKKWGTVAVSAAGILANLFIAVLFGILLRFSSVLSLPTKSTFIISSIVIVNLALAIFNLIPIPPLDGSKILFEILPKSFYHVTRFIEQYSLIFLILFIVFFSNFLYPVITYSFYLITGFAL